MAQVEQKAERVVWNRAVAQLPVLPGTVGNLTAARGGGHTQAQLFAAVAELFGGHKFFRLGVQDATPPRTQRHCRKIIGGLRDQQTIWLPVDNLASLR